MRILAMLIFLLGGAMAKDSGLDSIIINNTKIPIIYETSNALPIGSVSFIFYGAGSLYEDKIGVAAFSADILERGSEKSGEIEFAHNLESNAINISVGSGLETLSFGLDFLKEKQEIAFSLMRELLEFPNLTRKAFNQSQIALKSGLLAKENDFDYIAAKNLNALIYKGSRLEKGSLGEVSDIEKIALKDIERFIKKSLVLENLVILIGGAMDITAVKKDLVALLDFLPQGKEVARDIKIAPIAKAQNISAIKPTKQAFIYFASPFHFESYEDELHKAQVMSFIMGSSGFGSRVMEEIRVKRGLAYSAYFYNAIGNITTSTKGHLQTTLENKDEAINALKEVVAKFIKNGASERELADAKAYILGSRVLGDETLSSRLNKKFSNFNRGLPLDYDKTLTQKIKNLSLKELNEYIKSHKEVNELSFSVVVDK